MEICLNRTFGSSHKLENLTEDYNIKQNNRINIIENDRF